MIKEKYEQRNKSKSHFKWGVCYIQKEKNEFNKFF